MKQMSLRSLLTIAQPVFDAAGQIKTIVAVDFSVDTINQIMHTRVVRLFGVASC